MKPNNSQSLVDKAVVEARIQVTLNIKFEDILKYGGVEPVDLGAEFVRKASLNNTVYGASWKFVTVGSDDTHTLSVTVVFKLRKPGIDMSDFEGKAMGWLRDSIDRLKV